VRTSRCTDTLAMHLSSLEMRTFFQEVRRASDYNAMKSLAQAVGARDVISFSGSLARRKSGRCAYEGANGMSALLYTKQGKDILRLSFTESGHEVLVYTYPKAWAPELQYRASSQARIVTALSADPANPMDDVDASEAPESFWVTLGTGVAAAVAE
jgi:hypothetical protein